MIRVLDLERSMRLYRDAFDLDEVRRLDIPTFGLVCLRNSDNDPEVELRFNEERRAPYTHGDRHGHVAVWGNVDRERARPAQPSFGRHQAVQRRRRHVARGYFHVQDPEGYKSEVLERYEQHQ